MRRLSIVFLVLVSVMAFLAPGLALDYLPVDGQQNVTPSSVGLLKFLNATRNSTGGYALIRPNPGTDFWKTSTGGLALGALFNETDDGAHYGRMVLQVNGSFWVSDTLDNSGSAPNVIAASPLYGTAVWHPTSYMGRDIYIRQAANVYSAVCFVHLDHLFRPDVVRVQGYCYTNNSACPAADRVQLDNDPAMQLNDTAFSYDVNSSITHNITFTGYNGGCNGGVVVAVPLPITDLGSRAIQFENLDGNLTRSVLFGADDEGYPFGSSIFAADEMRTVLLNPYSLATVGQKFSRNADGATIYMQHDVPTPVADNYPLIASTHYRSVNAMLGTIDRSFQLGTVMMKAQPTSWATVLNCPPWVPVLANVAVPVTCPEVSLNQIKDYAGTVTGQPNRLLAFNSSYFPVYELVSPQTQTVSITDAATGMAYRTQYGGIGNPQLVIFNQVFSRNTTRLYKALFTPYYGSAVTAYFPIQFEIVSVLPTNVTAYANHRAIFLSYETNATGNDIPAPGLNVSINGNSTVCTTRRMDYNISNATYYSMECALTVPDALQELNTTVSYFSKVLNTTVTHSFNNVFFGTYLSETLGMFGIHRNDHGSAYYVTWDENDGRFYIRLEDETCLDPQVSREDINGYQRCKLLGCPSFSTVSWINGTQFTPATITCQIPGQKLCVPDPNFERAYTIRCGDLCEAYLNICPTNACNSDLSGCSNEAAISDDTAGSQVYSAVNWWLAWMVENVLTLVGVAIAIGVLLLFFRMADLFNAPYLVNIGAFLAAFIFVVTLILTNDYGLAIFIGILLIAGVFGAVKIFGGAG